MNRDEIRSTLVSWHERIADLEEQISALSEPLGLIVDTPFGVAVYSVAGAYTTAVAEKLGWDEETIKAWWLEHNFAEIPLIIYANGEGQKIGSTEELAQFVFDDLERSRKECEQ